VAAAALVGGVLGAKLTEWVVGNWSVLSAQPTAILDPRLGGKALGGGILGGWLGVEIAKRILGIRRSTGDLFALALPSGEAVGRVGCFLNGCCAGTAASVPWAVFQSGAWRHPAQLYSSAAALVVLAMLVTLRKHTAREGDLFRWYLVLFGVSRLALEFVRERSVAFGGLSAMQWLCIELAVVGTIGLRRSRARRVETPAA
jgi:phosphatidylglycerol:prolipoprotein diacylglycerol transferase